MSSTQHNKKEYLKSFNNSCKLCTELNDRDILYTYKDQNGGLIL